MPRHPRFALPGIPQHVIQRGVDRSILFVTESDYTFFGDCLREACETHECGVHAYVLMTNHVHLLMTPADATGVGRVMQAVYRRYVKRFNELHGRTGALCESRYKASIVDTERYLFACYRYIELNPLRAGLVDDPRDYPWSSYRSNALGTSDRVLTPHERYEALGRDAATRQAAYRALVATTLADATLSEIRNATRGGWALGSPRFREEVAALLGRRTQPTVRGRRPRGV